ncbi:hypothetical protein VTN00DRAFT_2205 [Thermoascus crustaceus]|uniref:uncharacterized protein n=1 Tax=Thermoascus crustaceus TaxID=5088 RepID=UPI0037441565
MVASGPSAARFRGCVESGADAGIALGKEHSVRAILLPEELLFDLRHRGSRAGEQMVLRVMADGDDDDGDACLQHVHAYGVLGLHLHRPEGLRTPYPVHVLGTASSTNAGRTFPTLTDTRERTVASVGHSLSAGIYTGSLYLTASPRRSSLGRSPSMTKDKPRARSLTRPATGALTDVNYQSNIKIGERCSYLMIVPSPYALSSSDLASEGKGGPDRRGDPAQPNHLMTDPPRASMTAEVETYRGRATGVPPEPFSQPPYEGLPTRARATFC